MKSLKISKITETWLLPLMLIKYTIAQNRWQIIGIQLDVLLYFLTIVMAYYIAIRSRYRIIIGFIFLTAVVSRAMMLLDNGRLLYDISRLSLALIFVFAGARIYGNNSKLLKNQLVGYLFFCIPLMLLQILGIDSFFHGWDVGNLDNQGFLTYEEIGTFKEFPLYPTLFIGADELVYSLTQGRPVGLMSANNALSVVVSIAIAVNFSVNRNSKIRFSDIIVTIAGILTMSKLVFGVFIILYSSFFVFNVLNKRRLVIRLIGIFVVGMFCYYLLFPGLFLTNLSVHMVLFSLLTRFVDLLKAMGVEHLVSSIGVLNEFNLRQTHISPIGYSTIAILLRNKFAIILVVGLVVCCFSYFFQLRKTKIRIDSIYSITLFTCLLTQIGVPFYKSPIFQLILGFALFPFFKKMWPTIYFSLKRKKIQYEKTE